MAHETRYHVFAGDDYYPGGGMNDHRGSFATLAEAVEKVKEPGTGYFRKTGDWAHIYATTLTGELEEVPRDQWEHT